ncbi:MAG: hypothetical protein DRP65_09400 [Planctomycetota bacterium]|nr:MAG: hypothetical protein DRP65_09400 [Planctomycetota bacterium]
MNTDITDIDSDRQPRFMHNVLGEQLKWLIKLRWFAILGIVTTAWICTNVFSCALGRRTYLHLCRITFRL